MYNMVMRNLAPGEYYHICTRGVRKGNIFHTEKDRARLLFALLHFQAPIEFQNIHRNIKFFLETGSFDVENDIVEKIVKNRIVELCSFSFISNHIHLMLHNLTENGITKYIQRSLNSYGKYYNTFYDASGHIFESRFKSVHVENNEQALHLSAYIHKNPIDIVRQKKKLVEYKWSSFSDYVGSNRWGKLLVPDLIMDQFENGQEYKEWVLDSPAKELNNPLFNI